MGEISFLRFKKLRFYFAWPFAIALALYGKTTDLGFTLGIPVIFLGEALRIWSQGCIQKRTRLATSGPYAFTRNPLYLSNFLLGLGFVAIFSNVWILFLFLIGFAVLYSGTILEEERFLSKEYGALYSQYLSDVPRFFPRLTPYKNRSMQLFDWNLVKKHGEDVTLLTIILLIQVLFLRQAWYQNGAGFFGNYKVIFFSAIGTLVLLTVLRLNRLKK